MVRIYSSLFFTFKVALICLIAGIILGILLSAELPHPWPQSTQVPPTAPGP
jgi:hypothetical protein